MINVENLERVLLRFPELKIVWTLHDMFPFTGGCHHALDCNRFQKSCSNCPQVHSVFEGRVKLALSKKRRFVLQNPEISFVSPSKWLAEAAMRSSVLRDKVVAVIPNPIRKEFTGTYIAQREARALAGYEPEAMLVFIVAENLADQNKNVQPFVDALPGQLPDGTKVKLVLVGSNGSSIKSNAVEVVRVGKLAATELAALLPAADFLAVPSQVENAPSTIWEAAALGVPSFANTSNPGGRELVTSMGFGISVDGYGGLSENLLALRALRREKSLEISRKALELGSGAKVVKRYQEIYSQKG
jgi:hypothetical protein